MRVLVFVLVLANLLFLAWAQGLLGGTANQEASRLHQQIAADQIRIVSRDTPPENSRQTKETPLDDEKKAPETSETPDSAAVAEKPAASEQPATPAATEKKPVDICLTTGEISQPEAERLEKRLSARLTGVRIERTVTTPGRSSYWVHIPPLATKKDAESKSEELRSLGVTEFFIMQDNGPNNRAISLGLFANKDGATALLESLRAKGVRSARIAERVDKPGTAIVKIRTVDTQREAVTKAASVVPAAKLTPCKNR
ncbi:SPOR domain-containing protein [Propionivibrio limicola]|uniref:SPOR domain-containing protein n=1 Tax=Propionivibrio limicola TaxID=167645 RepID=UPI001291978E|nr:SPOR domain-containing protein [Propionivibrio limicola]